MKTLRIAAALMLAGSMTLVGCGDDDDRGGGGGGGDEDAGTGGTDSGTAGGEDGGMTGTDGGGGSTGGMCPAGDCDLLSNEGCEAGEACYFLLAEEGADTPVPICQPAGTGGDGDPCDDYTDCQEGFDCDAAAGVCRHYCCGEPGMGCPTGQICVNLGREDGTSLGVGRCRPPDTCDLFEQTGCPEGEGCYPGSDGNVLCLAPRAGSDDGEECMFTNDCNPGLVCLEDMLCRAFCRPDDDPTTCPEGQACSPLAIAGMDNIGACTPTG